MQHPFRQTLALVLGAYFGSNLAMAETYHDPHGRFGIDAPAGWRVSASENSVQLSAGNDVFTTVMVLQGVTDPADLLSQVERQISSQWRNVQPLGKQALVFGGSQGQMSVITGTNPKSIPAFAAMYTATSRSHSFAVIQSGPMTEYRTVMKDLDAIAASFRIGSQTNVPVTRTHTYHSRDGSVSFDVPDGWTMMEPVVGSGVTFHVVGRNGGEERILVSAAPTHASSIQELVPQAVQALGQMMPALRVSGRPAFSRINGFNAAEVAYDSSSFSAGPETKWWQLLVLNQRTVISVLGVARPATLVPLQQACRVVAGSLRVEQTAQDVAPAKAVRDGSRYVGSWEFYHGHNIGTSVSKTLNIGADGTILYSACTFVPGMPPGVEPCTEHRGTYRIEGTRLHTLSADGASAVFTVELDPSGTAMKINGETFIRK